MFFDRMYGRRRSSEGLAPFPGNAAIGGKFLFIFGVSVSLIGMFIVVLALALLMGVIKAINIFTALTERATAPEEKGRKEGPAMHAMTPPVQMENDGETTAVIAASLAAFLKKK